MSPTRLSASQAYRMSLDACAFEQAHDTPLDADAWHDGSTGGGSISHEAAISAHVVSVSTANGARGLLRSHARPKAAVGKSRSTIIVGHASDYAASQKKRWGLFDDDNGHFFELDGEVMYVARRSDVSGSVVDERVSNALWSTNKTYVDVLKTHAWEIREVWPNGDISFFIDGELRHVISVKGSGVGPASRTSRLPVSVECVNSAVTASAAFKAIAAKVDVEQGPREARSFARTVANAAVGTSDTALLALRPAATFGSVANLGELLADLLTASCDVAMTVKLWFSTAAEPIVVTGGSWAAANAASIAEVNATPASFTGGQSIDFVVDPDGGLREDLGDVLSALRLRGDGTTQDTLVLTAAAASGTVSARAALSWKEIR